MNTAEACSAERAKRGGTGRARKTKTMHSGAQWGGVHS